MVDTSLLRLTVIVAYDRDTLWKIAATLHADFSIDLFLYLDGQRMTLVPYSAQPAARVTLCLSPASRN